MPKNSNEDVWKLYTIDEASNLSIGEVHNLYKDFINPNQTDIFSSLPFGNDTFESAEGVHMLLRMVKRFWTLRVV